MSGASHVEILEQRVFILEDTIKMLSYNLRCLNIRQGAQPIELPDIDCEDMFDEEAFNHMVKANERILQSVDLIYIGGHACTPDEFEEMQRNLVFNEHAECVPLKLSGFGACEEAWAK